MNRRGPPGGALGGGRWGLGRGAPVGKDFQAGTLSGNPLAMRAGIETLHLLDDPGFYERLEARGGQLEEGVGELAGPAGVSGQCPAGGAVVPRFSAKAGVCAYQPALAADTDRYAGFFRAMLEAGIHFAPSQFEAGFLSDAHSAADIEATLAAAKA